MAKAKTEPKAKAQKTRADQVVLSEIVSRARPANAGDMVVYLISENDFALLKAIAG